MKLQIGCGNKLWESFINCDKTIPSKLFDKESLNKHFNLMDIEEIPWIYQRVKIEDNSVDEIVGIHVMEHISKNYFEIWKEIYRICKPDAKINIIVPHFNHDNFKNDPTHKTIITPAGLQMFSKKFNQECIDKKYSNSTFGIDLDIDFEIVETKEILDTYWLGRKQYLNLNEYDIDFAKKSYNNVISEYDITLKVVK